MVLVFLCIIIAFIVLVISSKLEINIKELDLQNFDKKENKLFINISLKIFNLHWLKIKIDKYKIKNAYLKVKNQKKDIKINKIVFKIFSNLKENKKLKKELVKLNFNARSFNLNLLIGTEDASITAYLIGIISILISNILPHITKGDEYKSYFYKIEPVYIDKNIYKINLNCIFDAKLVHIIYVIFKVTREEKYERTSNRKSYEYSYE